MIDRRDQLPSGALTFLFTDLEGSTRLWEQHPDDMRAALARHDALLREAVASHNGVIVKSTGDGLHAVFESASDAVAAAYAGQLALIKEAWPGCNRLLYASQCSSTRRHTAYALAYNRPRNTVRRVACWRLHIALNPFG